MILNEMSRKWISLTSNIQKVCGFGNYYLITIFILAILITFNSCLYLPKHIIYINNQRKTDKYELQLLENKISLKIVSFGVLYKLQKQYSLFLSFNFEYNEVIDNISFKTSNIEIYLNNKKLTEVQNERRDTFFLKHTQKSYKNSLRFYVNLNSEELESLLNQKHEIKIILDKWISINDEFIFIDTINAYDPTLIDLKFNRYPYNKN